MGHWVKDPNKQRHRAAQPRNQPLDEGGGHAPDVKSVLMLATARLKHIAESEWDSGRYLDVSMLKEVEA